MNEEDQKHQECPSKFSNISSKDLECTIIRTVLEDFPDVKMTVQFTRYRERQHTSEGNVLVNFLKKISSNQFHFQKTIMKISTQILTI